ncbi:MAG: hypothetical protein R3221_04830 [Spongiibacter sp.]|uniref:Lipoprotein n=1 Tax=Spongiibacter thalassae TaxID=2721624 RepID=A0ABX1GHG3_9GAMM|nr:hypothetical protein [Spongiibacter thalassae]MDX1505016.1 hypothetical protein [Spongiibacter sp.]NKI18331.1 hypothetical protein [Spongiibacter thalassae]
MKTLLSVVFLCVTLSACSSGAYDDEREWRLSQCENILDDDDRAKCIRNTPYYTQ